MRRIILSFAVFAAASAPLHAQQSYYYSRVAPRGWLGITFSQQETSINGQRNSAVVITDVSDDSPARRAGLQPGDTIVRVNDFRASAELLGTMGSSVEPGDTVRFVIRRGGRDRTLPIVVAARPAALARETLEFGMVDGVPIRRLTIDPDSVRGRARLFVDSIYAGLDTTRFRAMFRLDSAGGFRSLLADSMIFHAVPGQVFQYGALADSARSKFRLLSPDSAAGNFGLGAKEYEFNALPGNVITTRGYLMGSQAFGGAALIELDGKLGEYFDARAGVLVLSVPKGSPADRAGLQAGDVVTNVNGTTVASIVDVRRVVDAAAPRSPIRLNVIRHGNRVNLELRRD